MSSHIKALQERRANIWEQTKALLDAAEADKRDLTAEEESSYQALNGDLDKIDARVKDLTEAEQRTKDAEAAFAGLLSKPQEQERKTETDSELRRWARGEQRGIDIAKPDGVAFRDLVKSSATAGGNTVPTTFYGQLMAHLIEVSGVMMAGPTVLNTSSGETIEIPVTTAHSSAALTAEAGTLTESDPAFAKRALGAYKYGVLLQASSELLTDTGVDLEGYLAMQAGRALGNAFGAHAITGDGSSKPTGVITSASALRDRRHRGGRRVHGGQPHRPLLLGDRPLPEQHLVRLADAGLQPRRGPQAQGRPGPVPVAALHPGRRPGHPARQAGQHRPERRRPGAVREVGGLR